MEHEVSYCFLKSRLLGPIKSQELISENRIRF
jgi:hypothetical protein